MAEFKIAYLEVMKIEGGYANHPLDRGGETWKGISRKNHPNWAGWQIVDSFKNKPGFETNLAASNALQQQVLILYKQIFWDVMRLDEVKLQKIATEMFDTGINCGATIPVVFLQKALNVTNRNQQDYKNLTVDGNMGPVTVSTLNNHPRPEQVFKLLNAQQGTYYLQICETRESQEIFMTSWLSRVTM